MNNVLPVDGKFKNRGLNRYKYSKIKVENEDAQPIDAEFENEGLNKYAYEDIDGEEELFVYAPNMAAAKIQMQLLFGEDDGIYLYRENAYSKPLTNVETGEDICPSDLYFTYSGLLKSGEIKQTFQEYINQQIDDGILETKGKKKKKKEGASKVKENKRPESEATNVGSIGQFKRGGIRPGAPMDQDDYEKWSEQEDGSTQNEDHFDEDESTTPKFEEDQGVMVRKFKDKNGDFGYYMSKDGGETWFPTEVQKFGGGTNAYSTTTSSTDVVTEADEKTQGVVDYVKDGVKDDLKNGVENVKSVVGKGENQKTDDEQEADEKAKEGNENTDNQNQQQAENATPIVKQVTQNGMQNRIRGLSLGTPFTVFDNKIDYNVVFANGLSDKQSQQLVNEFSDFYVFPQGRLEGTNKRYQFLISASSKNPITGAAQKQAGTKKESLNKNITESRLVKRICRANKLNELNIKKEGTEEYILYKQINDKSCAKSIYEAYIKDSGDDALCTYWETNKLIDTPKIKKEGKKVMRRNVNENSNPKYVSRPAIIKFIKRKYRDKNYTTEQIEDLLDEKGVEYFDIGYRWVGHPNEYERCDSEPDCKKEGKKVMRNNRRRVNEKNMMLRGRRVTENYGLGMSLNLLKDMTGIADTDELLAKIDEFVLFNDCDPIFDESCRDQFVDYCNNGGDDFGCEECGDFGRDNFGGELSDEAFDNFGEEDDEGEEPTFDEAIDLGDFDFDEDDEIVEDEGDEDEGDDIKAGLDDEDEGEEEEEEEPEEDDEDEEEKKEESYRRRNNRSRKNEWFLPYDAGKRISDYARTHRDEFDELSDEAFDNFGLDDECPECRREINPIPPVFAKESCGKKKPTKKGRKKKSENRNRRVESNEARRTVGPTVLCPKDLKEGAYGAYLYKNGKNYGFVDGESDFESGELRIIKDFFASIYLEENDVKEYANIIAGLDRLKGVRRAADEDINTFYVIIDLTENMPNIGFDPDIDLGNYVEVKKAKIIKSKSSKKLYTRLNKYYVEIDGQKYRLDNYNYPLIDDDFGDYVIYDPWNGKRGKYGTWAESVRYYIPKYTDRFEGEPRVNLYGAEWRAMQDVIREGFEDGSYPEGHSERHSLVSSTSMPDVYGEYNEWVPGKK